MLKRPCQFFNTTGKCRFGKHCKFVHDIDILQQENQPEINKDESVKGKELVTEERGQSISNFESEYINNSNGVLNKEGQEKANLCRFYAKTRFCKYGNRCRYKHVLPKKEVGDLKDESNSEIKDEIKNENQQDQVQNEGQEEIGGKPEKVSNIIKKQCKFFKKGYCRYGTRCTFYHADKQEKKPIAEASPLSQSSIKPENTTIKVDQTSEAQTETGWRQISRPPRIINVFSREDVDEKKQAELRDTEIKQLKRRFPTEHLQIVEETEENANFIFTFFPTDPDWPFDVKSFEIQVEIGQDYPFKLFTVSVPLDQDLPATVQRYIEVSLREWVEKKEDEMKKKNIVELLFRPFLRWMDRNMETIVTEGLKQLRRELTAKAAGLQFISAKELKKDIDQQASSEQDETSDVSEKDSRRPVAYRKSDHVEEVYETPAAASDGSADDDDDGEEDDDSDDTDDSDEAANDDKVHQRPKIDLDTDRRGTEMSFKNMQIWYCTTIMVEKLRLTVQCERCKNKTDFVTPPNRVNSIACSKCNNTQLVVFRPVLTHAYSSTFGYLDLDGCVAFDVILQDCHFSLGCVSCSRDILVKSCTAGRVMEVWCRGCHSKMKFAADSVKLMVITSDGVDKANFSGKIHTIGARKNQRVLKDPAIQEGKPLPNTGACKHYKKSFRWLRFPCCGKTYPCDICHDDKEDHEMKYANRMICGFCCKEQPFALEKPCSGCSSALTKVRTSHWEGGRGCRDKISMSRSDDKKYVNLNKTVSNKAKEKTKSKKNTKLRHT